MKLSILYITQSFRGDHAADISIALDCIENESVEHLMLRAKGLGQVRADEFHMDHVQIRVVKEAR